MSVISMKQLLEAGVHFGHQTRRWNPKMAPYIYTERNGIYIIDLQKSVGKVDEAYKAVADIAANGGNILLHDLKADHLSATIKNGHITGNIQGSWDQYEIFCTVKKGNSNLPEYKSGGPNQMKIEANNGDIDLTIEP